MGQLFYLEKGEMEKSYQVYVIQNAEGRFYIGLSEDVHHRLNQHNNGESKWTKGKGPWELVWTGEEMNLSDATRLERHLKCQKGGLGFYKATGLEKRDGS